MLPQFSYHLDLTGCYSLLIHIDPLCVRKVVLIFWCPDVWMFIIIMVNLIIIIIIITIIVIMMVYHRGDIPRGSDSAHGCLVEHLVSRLWSQNRRTLGLCSCSSTDQVDRRPGLSRKYVLEGVPFGQDSYEWHKPNYLSCDRHFMLTFWKWLYLAFNNWLCPGLMIHDEGEVQRPPVVRASPLTRRPRLVAVCRPCVDWPWLNTSILPQAAVSTVIDCSSSWWKTSDSNFCQ